MTNDSSTRLGGTRTGGEREAIAREELQVKAKIPARKTAAWVSHLTGTVWSDSVR